MDRRPVPTVIPGGDDVVNCWLLELGAGIPKKLGR